MTALAKDRHLDFKDPAKSSKIATDVKADTRIFAHSYVGLDGVVARPLVAGDSFIGIAVRQEDNRDGAVGDKRIETEFGHGVKVKIAAATEANLGAVVYASDDNTETLTATDNTAVGALEQYLGANTFWMRVFRPGESAQA